MNELLALLREAYVQVNEMRKVADDSVADYILNLEVTMRFIEKALNTEDRLDVFKALQKAYDVLEREEESYEDEEQDDYDELVDRLKAALDGLNERVFMKESELKSLVKMILNEIYMEPEEEHPLAQLFQKLSKAVQNNNPAFVDISKGHELSHKIVSAIMGDIKLMVKASVGNQKKEFSAGVEAFEHHSSSLMNFLIGWAQQIHMEHPETEDNINRVMDDLKTHVQQMGAQFKSVFMNLRQKNDLGKPNLINATRELQHLNEIFNSLKESIDTLFQIGLDAGYGKKK